jgi:cobalamin biosynthetic protein CobC
MPDRAAPSGPPRHGGALRDASEIYGIAPSDWLDLSTGINPDAYPLAPQSAAAWRRLPDPRDLAALVAIARAAYCVPPDAAIAAVPGSDAALRLLPLLRPPDRVAILSPTYGGHAEAWAGAGHAVAAVGTLEEAAGFPVVVLANPNNPDGRVVPPHRLTRFATALAGPDGLLVVDEAFADVDPAASIAPHLAGEPVVVLRSFGKFYGLAGLRLGFAIGAPVHVDRLAALFGDWPLATPAILAATAALADRDWQGEARRRLAERRRELDALLAANGFSRIAGTDLFRLVRTAEAAALHRHLAASGIWTRIFAELPDAIRFGLPPQDGLARLEAALRRRGTS